MKNKHTYNIRSWTSGITGPLFRQRLYYNEVRDPQGCTPSYSGNISSMEWKARQGATMGYDFHYSHDGRKLRTVRNAPGLSSVTDYCGNVIYRNGKVDLLLVANEDVNGDSIIIYPNPNGILDEIKMRLGLDTRYQQMVKKDLMLLKKDDETVRDMITRLEESELTVKITQVTNPKVGNIAKADLQQNMSLSNREVP